MSEDEALATVLTIRPEHTIDHIDGRDIVHDAIVQSMTEAELHELTDLIQTQCENGSDLTKSIGKLMTGIVLRDARIVARRRNLIDDEPDYSDHEITNRKEAA